MGEPPSQIGPVFMQKMICENKAASIPNHSSLLTAGPLTIAAEPIYSELGLTTHFFQRDKSGFSRREARKGISTFNCIVSTAYPDEVQ